MFEQGDGTKLNDEVINRLAAKFGVKLRDGSSAESQPVRAPQLIALLPHTGYCPNPACPSHHRYQVEERTLIRPDRVAQDPAGGKYCAVCGEVLERRCPNCGAPVHDGAICSLCGEPYLSL